MSKLLYTSSVWGSRGRYHPHIFLIPNFPKRTTNLQHSKRDGGFVLGAFPLHTGRLIGLARLVSGRSQCLPSLLLSSKSEWFVYCLIVSSFMICFLPPVRKFNHLLWSASACQDALNTPVRRPSPFSATKERTKENKRKRARKKGLESLGRPLWAQNSQNWRQMPYSSVPGHRNHQKWPSQRVCKHTLMKPAPSLPAFNLVVSSFCCFLFL